MLFLLMVYRGKERARARARFHGTHPL